MLAALYGQMLSLTVPARHWPPTPFALSGNTSTYSVLSLVFRSVILMDKASRVLAQGLPPAVPTSYRALADLARTCGALEITSSVLHHYRPGNIIDAFGLGYPAELAAPKTRPTWLQLLYSLAADILHAHGATTTPPEACYDAVARPRKQLSALVSARASQNAILLSRPLELYGYPLPPSSADLYSARHG
jgi:hypothetical protein